jgi:D-threo-aldose 1-dehydrogenase
VSLRAGGLGTTGIEVTEVCFGTSPLASMARLYGYDVDERRAIDTVLAVLDSPIRFIDTSNGYGENGTAERRIGAALREYSGLPDDVVLATKVDPDPATGDFSGARVRASLYESLERLGVDRVPLLHLHDPERISFEQGTADDGPVAALVELKNEGVVDRIGVAGGPVDLLGRYLDTGVFDVLLSHNRYTLLDRSAEALFHAAHERGIGVLNAAPFGGGMLAKGPDVQRGYAYGERDDRVAAAASAMQDACLRHGVTLAAAALQFSLRSPSVDSTVVGISTPERVAQTLEYAEMEIPAELWDELEALVPPSELWLN